MVIYFLQDPDGGAVKIGYTDNFPARLKQLEARYGRPMVVLGTCEGGPEEERAIHERFAHLRFGRTEQFRPAADLMALIGRPLLASPNPDAVEAMADGRVFVIHLKGSPAYKEWLDGISDETLIPVASIVRDALAKWAKRRGYSDPPEL
jgi:hypothetical protein